MNKMDMSETDMSETDKMVLNIFKHSKIKGQSCTQYLEFVLHKDEKIITALDTLIAINGNIDGVKMRFDGIGVGIMRVLAGENFVHQEFHCKQNKGFLLIGTNYTDNIVHLKIKNGQVIRFSRGSFLACTTNIFIDYTTQMKGIFGIGQNEGFILPTATCKDGKFGHLWLTNYGSIEKIKLNENDTLLINNGRFLACDNNTQYTVELLDNNVLFSLFGGSGFGMKFNGPGEIIIQTKDPIVLYAANDTVIIEPSAPPESSGFISNFFGNTTDNGDF